MNRLALRVLLTSAAILAIGTGAGAQTASQQNDVTPLSVLDDGRLLVEIDGSVLDCSLVKDGSSARLDECRYADPGADGSAFLESLSTEEWKGSIRDVLMDADCKLSAFDAIADFVERAALDRGIDPETVALYRDDLTARAEQVADEMLKDGALTFRDGELALDSCK